MILKLIGMILLGILSAALSYYNKNYYVRLFNDILGREEDEKASARVGRGFFYGFFFPFYFVLLLTGLIFLIAFLIVAGIIAAIIFVLVMITEKILPNEWVGDIAIGLFKKVGLSGVPEPPAEPAPPATSQEADKPGEPKE